MHVNIKQKYFTQQNLNTMDKTKSMAIQLKSHEVPRRTLMVV